MKNLQLSNKAFVSPVVGFPRIFDQVRARLQRGKTGLDKEVLLPKVFDFVLTDAKSFETKDYDSKAFCPSRELAVLDVDAVDRFFESVDGTESFPIMHESVSFTDCVERLPTQSCYDDQRGCFRSEDSGMSEDRLILDPVIVQSIHFLPMRSGHELMDEMPYASSMIEGDSQSGNKSFHSYAGIEFLESVPNGPGKLHNVVGKKRAQQMNLPLLISQESWKEELNPTAESYPVLLNEVILNHMWGEKQSHTLPDALMVFANSSQKSTLDALLKDYCNDVLQMESRAGRTFVAQPEFNQRKVFQEEDSLQSHKQEHLHLHIETKTMLPRKCLKLEHFDHKEINTMLLVGEEEESCPPFLFSGPSLSSKLYADIIISTSRLPFLDSFKCRLPSFDTLIDATTDMFSVTEVPVPRQIISQTSQKIYLDWKLLDSDLEQTDEFLLQCFQSVQMKGNVCINTDLSLQEWRKIVLEESRFFAPETLLRNVARIEKRDSALDHIDHSPENATKERECQVQRDRDPISYFKHLKNIQRFGNNDHKSSPKILCAKERVIEVQLGERQRKSLVAISYDYQILSASLPSSLNISLREFDLYDSQCAYSIRQELQSSSATNSRDMKERERFGSCLILRQVAIAVIEYGCQFANILLSDSLQKMSRKYPELQHHFRESRRTLKECVAEIERTYAADHQKQDIMKNEIRAILLNEKKKKQSILILADAEAFFTISTCLTEGGAVVAQIKDRNKFLDEGPKSELSEVFEESLKAHNCILWSCEEVKSNFPFEVFSHVFIYSETTGLHVKNICEIIGAGQYSLEVIRLAMVKESIEAPLPQSLQYPIPVSDRGSLCAEESKKADEETMGQNQQDPCIVVNASGYVSNNKQLMEYFNRMPNVIFRNLGRKKDTSFPIDFVLSLSKCVLVIESLPCESPQYLEDYFKALVSSISDLYSSCVLVIQNFSESIQDQDLLRKCLSRIGKLNGVEDVQLLVATSHQDMLRIVSTILEEARELPENSFLISSKDRTSKDRYFFPESKITQAELEFGKACHLNPLLVALFVSREIHPEKAMDMSLKKLGDFFQSNSFKIEQRLLQRIHLYLLRSDSACNEQEHCSENDIPLDILFPSDIRKSSGERRKSFGQEFGQNNIGPMVANEVHLAKDYSRVFDLPAIGKGRHQRNHSIRNQSGNYMQNFMGKERFAGMSLSRPVEGHFRLDGDFNDVVDTPFSKGAQHPSNHFDHFDPYRTSTTKSFGNSPLQNGSHKVRHPSSNTVHSKASMIQDYIISSDEEGEGQRREPRKVTSNIEQIQTYTLYRKNGPPTEFQHPQMTSASEARSRKSIEWDSNAVLANWNQYRQQRHYSECTQTFLGRKPKRRKKARAWGKRKF